MRICLLQYHFPVSSLKLLFAFLPPPRYLPPAPINRLSANIYPVYVFLTHFKSLFHIRLPLRTSSLLALGFLSPSLALVSPRHSPLNTLYLPPPSSPLLPFRRLPFASPRLPFPPFVSATPSPFALPLPPVPPPLSPCQPSHPPSLPFTGSRGLRSA